MGMKRPGLAPTYVDARCGAEPPPALLTLSKASYLSDVAIHELKRAIREGRMRAAWQGRYYVVRADLEEFLHGL